MSLKTKVKVGNITNLSDARYCAGMGVDLLGFPIGKGEGKISMETFKEIAEWVAGPEFILELTDAMDHDLLEKVTQMESIKHIQLNFSQLDQLNTKLGSKSLILNTNVIEWIERGYEMDQGSISYLIISSTSLLDWQKIEEINEKVPVLVALDGLSKDIKDVDTLPIAGIVLEGSAEDKPGHKNYDHLAEVLEMLEID